MALALAPRSVHVVATSSATTLLLLLLLLLSSPSLTILVLVPGSTLCTNTVTTHPSMVMVTMVRVPFAATMVRVGRSLLHGSCSGDVRGGSSGHVVSVVTIPLVAVSSAMRTQTNCTTTATSISLAVPTSISPTHTHTAAASTCTSRRWWFDVAPAICSAIRRRRGGGRRRGGS